MTECDGSNVQGLVIGHKANGRCVYSRAGKRALVEQALRPGVSTARLAMTHGVNANLLRKWIQAYQAQVSLRDRAKPALLPVLTTPPQPSVATAASLEIMIGAATIRLHGAVDAQQLRTVMDCLMPRR